MNCKNKFCFVKTNILKVFALFTEIKGLVVSTKKRGPNISTSREFSALFYFISGPPKHFIRRQTVIVFPIKANSKNLVGFTNQYKLSC